MQFTSAILALFSISAGLAVQGVTLKQDRTTVRNKSSKSLTPHAKRFYSAAEGLPVHHVVRTPNRSRTAPAKSTVYITNSASELGKSTDISSVNAYWDSDASQPQQAQQKSMRQTYGAYGAYGFFDDVFEEEAEQAIDQFQKRGLSLADKNMGDGSYDGDFLEKHQKFLGALLAQQQYAIPDISSTWKAYPGERAYRTSRLYTRWKSVDCSVLDMRLKMVGTIYDGHRNRVIKLYDRISRQTFAYKTYGNPDEFYSELEVFLWLDHPYFAKAICHRKDTESGKAGILFEYVDGKPSHEYAKDASPEELKMISAQLLVAIEHLHWLGIVHADMKPENVLIRSDGTVQVIDMGFAVHLPQARRGRGTHTTMAPELFNLVPGKVHEAIDWWAYGSTVAMWYGANKDYSNNDGRRFIPMYLKDRKYIVGTVPWKFDANLRKFLHIFFQPHPEQRRLNTKRLLRQLREHEFFEGFDWSQVHGGLLN